MSVSNALSEFTHEKTEMTESFVTEMTDSQSNVLGDFTIGDIGDNSTVTVVVHQTIASRSTPNSPTPSVIIEEEAEYIACEFEATDGKYFCSTKCYSCIEHGAVYSKGSWWGNIDVRMNPVLKLTTFFIAVPLILIGGKMKKSILLEENNESCDKSYDIDVPVIAQIPVSKEIEEIKEIAYRDDNEETFLLAEKLLREEREKLEEERRRLEEEREKLKEESVFKNFLDNPENSRFSA